MTDAHLDHALTFVVGLGRATHCAGYLGPHRPTPQRYVWHHILPQACGGLTRPINLVPLCDSCHYATHALLTTLATLHTDDVKVLGRRGTPFTRDLAVRGYQAAVVQGTADRIPNEGGAPE